MSIDEWGALRMFACSGGGRTREVSKIKVGGAVKALYLIEIETVEKRFPLLSRRPEKTRCNVVTACAELRLLLHKEFFLGGVLLKGTDLSRAGVLLAEVLTEGVIETFDRFELA